MTICTETIVCPNCASIEYATVTFTVGDPFATYIHECENCGYTIMESEWETVDNE